jgi:hypothetical protein
VLLVGCRRGPKEEVLPFLEETTEKQKDAIQTRLESYLATIFPAVDLKRHIDLAFLPVGDESRWPTSPGWREGCYVLRIAVVPTEPHITYFFSYNQLARFSRQAPNRPLPLEDEQIYEFMKQRYRDYCPARAPRIACLRPRGNWVPCSVEHNAVCRFPERGRPKYGGKQD